MPNRITDRPRRARAQPPQHRRHDSARKADRHHGAVGIGQIVARVRYHLCRGAAALRRIAVRLRAPVPRADGEARRRLDRRAVAGDLDRAEDGRPQPALDRRHRHGDLRLSPPALCARRDSALPQLRAPRGSGRARARSPTSCSPGRRRAHRGPRAAGAGAKGRVPRAVRVGATSRDSCAHTSMAS